MARPTRPPVAPTRLDVIASLARGIPPKDKGFAPTLLRARIGSGRDVLAYAATKGALVADGLDALGLRAAGAAPDGATGGAARTADPRVIADYEPELVAAYAQVSALQFGDARGRAVAIGLYRLLHEAGSLARLKRRHLDLYPQLLFATGAYAEVPGAQVGKLTPSVAAFLGADLLGPAAGGRARADWLAALSAALISSPETVPVGLLDEGPTLFDALTAGAVTTPATGPLITVITSAYNPGQPLLTAARSMVEQTWQDWELLVVDDASPAPQPGVLEAVEALDPRIRVIRKAVNGGTYRCRNTAMRQARGGFITCLDSDDWAHPQRLELGVAPLLAQPGLMATRSLGVRADESLTVTRPGYAGPFVAASALLFRGPEVMGRIGFFDTIRKAADTEYARRIEAAFGQRVLDIPNDILTILRSSTESLSADDFAAGWRHEARPAYKQAYTRWHEAINHTGADPFLDPDAARTFPAPRRWTRPVDAKLAAPQHIDLVIAGDWRRYGGPQVSMMNEIAAALAAGLRVAVMHIEALRFYTSQDQPLCEPVQDLISSSAVERIFPDDDIDVDILLIRYPPILQFPPSLPRTFTPRRLFVMANQAPHEPDGSDPRYVPADVTAHAEGLFGVVPQWIPQGPTIRRILEAELPPGLVTDWDNPGLIDVDAWHVRSERPVAERPVVGRFSRDNPIKFPDDPADLLAAYALPEPYAVRMMGATATVPALLKQADAAMPANWTLLEHKEKDVREFLSGVDFVVYMDNPNAHEAFGRALLESATCGAVVIAAPKHADTFGEACVYAEPAGVRALLDAFVANPPAYAAQVARSQAWVRDHFSTERFAERMHEVLGAIRTESPSPATAVDSDALAPSASALPGLAGQLPGPASQLPGPAVQLPGPAGKLDTEPDEPAWVTIALRRGGDGEHADSLAARHTGGEGGHAAALATLRDLADALTPGASVTPELVAQAARPGVTAIAQQCSGAVTRFPVNTRP